MTTLRQELMNCINDIPDDKLLAIKPLLFMLSKDTMTIEKLSFESLSDEEKADVEEAERDFLNGNTVSHEDIDWD